MTKTAVEWLIEELKKVHHPTEAMIMYAKKLEKQQIIDTYLLDEPSSARKYAEQYYNETYGSKGSDEHIVDTNEMIDQVPDVRKMVEDEKDGLYNKSSQTEISDEEIEEYAMGYYDNNGAEYYVRLGAKWYREQLKKKQ